MTGCAGLRTARRAPRPVLPSILFVLGFLALPRITDAQTVTGQVRAAGTIEPIRAAWVVLLDRSGAERAATLSDSVGRFALRAPVTGRFVVRASQLGHEDAVSDLVDVVAGRALDVTLELRPRALPLDGLTVEVERRCDVSPVEGSAAQILWDEARKALSAVDRTARSGLVTYTTRYFERTYDLRGRQLTETFRDGVSRGGRPFSTPPPADLAANGFVQQGVEGPVFYGPDAEVLLSDEFANTHCFRARRGRGENAASVGLSFEPVSGRDVADIAGTLWIDTATAGLRYLEFTYRGINYGPRTNELGGRVDFGRLPSGAWITERWRIRGPVIPRPQPLARRPRDLPVMQDRPELAGFKEAGAVLVTILDQRLPGGRDSIGLRETGSGGGGDVTRILIEPLNGRSALDRSGGLPGSQRDCVGTMARRPAANANPPGAEKGIG